MCFRLAMSTRKPTCSMLSKDLPALIGHFLKVAHAAGHSTAPVRLQHYARQALC